MSTATRRVPQTKPDRIDPITTSVIQGALENIAVEMGYKLMRMSYSSIIRESEDFGAALVDAEGRGLAESAQSTPLQSGPIPGYIRGVQKIFAEHDAGLFIERAEGLIHQQNVGLQAQRTRKRRPLTHATGELCRVMIAERGETHRLECAAGPVLSLGSRHSLECHSEQNVFEHRVPGKQCIFLENEGQVPRHGSAYRRAGDRDGAGRRSAQAADDVQERRLSATGRPDHAEQFTPRDVDPQRP